MRNAVTSLPVDRAPAMVMGAFKQTRWPLSSGVIWRAMTVTGGWARLYGSSLGLIRLGEIQLVRRSRRLARSSWATDLESMEVLKST
jgi:hypothetical protein